MDKENIKEYVLDAEGKKLGRLASQTAAILMGKNRSDFARNRFPNVKVKVKNTSKISITDAKLQESYTKYSGYPGGIKRSSVKKMRDTKGMGEVFRIAVRGMLPKNKLRDRMIKNLEISE